MEQLSRSVKWPDFVVAAGIVAVAILLAVFTLPARSAMVVGLPAWLFPLASLVVAGAGGLALVVLALCCHLPPMLDGGKTLRLAKGVAFPVAVIVAAGALMPVIGSLIAAPALVATLMLWMGERSIPRLFGTALVFPLAVAAFAAFVLGTPLP